VSVATTSLTPWDPEDVESVLDAEGRLTDARAADGIDLRGLYRQIVAARSLDVRLARLNLPLFVSAAGEEAPLVALARLMRDGDVVYAGPRDLALPLIRGLGLDEVLRQLVAHPDASAAGRGTLHGVASWSQGVFSITEQVGLHVALAAGQAHARKLADDNAVAIAVFGEGSTTTGHVHEAMILAARLRLPLVFVCKTQPWPDDPPVEAGVIGDGPSERARVLGIWSKRVDGADPLGTLRTLGLAIERARGDHGPAFVEVVVTPLQGDVPAHRDPLERLRRHLDAAGQWTSTFHDVVEAEFKAVFEKARALVLDDDGAVE
jgi:TPP-dependent pyruvate/acetoin dehydrogenase alpha subunit